MKSVVLLVLVIILVLVAAYVLSPRRIESLQHPVLMTVRENFMVLNPEYGKIPLKEGNSAYTENKQVITLCLKNPETGVYYDINTIMYVALHELAHVVTKSQNHTDEFKHNFNTLLQRASVAGIYNPNIPIPSTYCGISEGDDH